MRAALCLGFLLCAGSLHAQAPNRAALRDSIASERRSLASATSDSVLLQLAIARQLYRLERPRDGRLAVIEAARATSHEAIQKYRRELLRDFPGTSWDLPQFDSLTADKRAEYIRAEWDESDVLEGLPAGGTLRELFRRRALADAEYRIATGAHAGEWDDRGRVVIKQGVPEARIPITVGGVRYEIWRYRRAFGTLILYFTTADSVGDRRALLLVSSLEDAPAAVRRGVCKVDVEACRGIGRDPVAGAFSGPATSSKSFWAARNTSITDPQRTVRGAEAIDFATGVRVFRHFFAHALKPQLQVVRVNNAAGTASQLVVAFQFSPSELRSVANAAGRTYPVRFHVIVLDDGGHRLELDTIAKLRTVDPGSSDSTLAGMFTVELPDSLDVASIAITQSDGRGMLWQNYTFGWDPSPPLGTNLVLGNPRSGLRWTHDSLVLWLNPAARYFMGDTVHAYIQTMGLAPYRAARARIVLGDGETPGPGHRIVERAIVLDTVDDRIGHYFTFPLDTLPPGRYHVSFGIWWDQRNSTMQSATFRSAAFSVLPRPGRASPVMRAGAKPANDDEVCALYAAALGRVIPDTMHPLIMSDSNDMGVPQFAFHAWSGLGLKPAGGMPWTDSTIKQMNAVNFPRGKLAPCVTAIRPMMLVPYDTLAAQFKDRVNGWDDFTRKYPGHGAIVLLSYPRWLNAEHTEAMVYLATASHWLSGGGHLIYIRREGAKWVVVGEAQTWVS